MTNERNNAQAKSNMPHQLFQSCGHNYKDMYMNRDLALLATDIDFL